MSSAGIGKLEILLGEERMRKLYNEEKIEEIGSMKKKIDTQKPQVRFITDETGHKQFVVIKLEVYQNMLEELDDLRTFEERKNEPIITNEEMKNRLEKSGKLQH